MLSFKSQSPLLRIPSGPTLLSGMDFLKTTFSTQIVVVFFPPQWRTNITAFLPLSFLDLSCSFLALFDGDRSYVDHCVCVHPLSRNVCIFQMVLCTGHYCYAASLDNAKFWNCTAAVFSSAWCLVYRINNMISPEEFFNLQIFVKMVYAFYYSQQFFP